eukprot:5116707-Pleurochrysis_carterae.AAC.2
MTCCALDTIRVPRPGRAAGSCPSPAASSDIGSASARTFCHASVFKHAHCAKSLFCRAVVLQATYFTAPVFCMQARRAWRVSLRACDCYCSVGGLDTGRSRQSETSGALC